VRKILGLIVFCICFSGASPARASVIITYDADNPITHAGPLPSSALNLSGQLPDTVYGNLGPDLNAVNVFAISIFQPLNFSAFTFPVAHGAQDTELFLFNSSGRAVYENDDISASDTLSCLPSLSGTNPCPSSRGGLAPIASGLYYLAITRSQQLPWDSAQNYLFTVPVDSTSLGGPNLAAGGANPIARWDGGAFTDPNFDNSFYGIALTGTTPEPGTMLMLSVAGALGLLLRKRLSSNCA